MTELTPDEELFIAAVLLGEYGNVTIPPAIAPLVTVLLGKLPQVSVKENESTGHHKE
jgi:hypothetical protein